MQNPPAESEEFNIERAKLLVDSLVSVFAEIAGEELLHVDINNLFPNILNFIPSITISDFSLDRATVPIPGYRPGVFPEDFKRIKTISELDTIASQSLSSYFTIEVVGASRIKAKGFGELDLYKNGDKIEVKAKNLWFIEEVQEIEPLDEDVPKRVGLLHRIIKEVILDFIAKFLVVFINR